MASPARGLGAKGQAHEQGLRTPALPRSLDLKCPPNHDQTHKGNPASPPSTGVTSQRVLQHSLRDIRILCKLLAPVSTRLGLKCTSFQTGHCWLCYFIVPQGVYFLRVPETLITALGYTQLHSVPQNRAEGQHGPFQITAHSLIQTMVLQCLGRSKVSFKVRYS